MINSVFDEFRFCLMNKILYSFFMNQVLYTILIILLITTIQPEGLPAQTPAQTLRGQVTDAVTGSPLYGVTVIVSGLDPVKGTSTDNAGNFQLSGVPIGRQTIRFSYVGYEDRIINELMVTSAREVVLNVSLLETVTEMDALVVHPEMNKDQPINTMAISSARLLNMEEASRYAGGFDDPARLASSFAGVAGNLADNAIVVRGNSPKGMLWLMEGIEIPSPSHFGNILTMGGGGITALSTHMIADSDFYTGAFPAEYGNAMSGVFDLNLRTGNNRKFEHAVKTGIIGLDVASEGPISGDASYLFNYRYSTFSLISPLLPEDADGISYQNFSYKVNIPTSKSGTYSLWGIGATDKSGSSAEEIPADWIYNQDREDTESPTRFGAAGLRHRILFGNTSLITSVAASGDALRWKLDRFTDDASVLYTREHLRIESGKLTAKMVLNSRISSRHSNRLGGTINRLGYNQRILRSTDPANSLERIVDETGHSYLFQAFTQSRLIIMRRFIITSGIHLQYFALTDASSLEPRIGAEYLAESNTFHLSYGRHSQTEPLSIYFSHPLNRVLALAKADHWVAGYSRMFNRYLHLNLELYYQALSDIPVVPDSSFSLINLELDWFFNDRLVNSGSGRNYGLELTIERYLSNGWYALLTGSVFESKYSGGDGIWRDTRFNRKYTFALLGGKEWEFRSGRRVRFFNVNGRINVMGGKRLSPVNEQLTRVRREVFYDESLAFSHREPAVLYADMTLEYRTNRTNTSSVWSLQILNLTGYREFYGYRYNLRVDTIDEEREMILIPNLSYKIEF
jgi:hypothetical protein